jgi:hypothetical protein
MNNGGTVVARIFAVWLLILVLSIGLLFGFSSAFGGSSEAGLAVMLCLVIIVLLSLILAIVIIFAYREYNKNKW